MKYHPNFGRQGNSTTYCSDTVTPYNNERDGQKAASTPFHQER